MIDVQGLFALVLLGVWIYALIEVLATDKTQIRNLPKWAWFVIVLVFAVIGAFAWFFFGRPQRPFADVSSTTSTYEPRPRRPRPPSRADRAAEEADLRDRIAERDRMLQQWAEEEGHGADPPPAE